MKLSDFVVDFLAKEGVTHVFELPGGATTHLLDSICKRRDIHCLTTHHEQAAAFAAEGYSRVTRNIGVAMATSGPGATNLITGIASAYFESIPCLFITGQVNTYEFKYKKPVRQLGFQETDIVSIVKPITKDALLLDKPDDILYHLQRAVFIAKGGRPGPVLIDIPMNIQRTEIDERGLKQFYEGPEHKALKNKFASCDQGYEGTVLDLIKEASRPVILAGHGVIISNAEAELFDFANKTNVPVVTSLMGIGSFPEDHPLSFGMIGTYGNRFSNLTLANADLIIGIGTRFDIRQTGNNTNNFARGAKIIHIDIDRAEMMNRIRPHLSILSDANTFLSKINKRISNINFEPRTNWLTKLNTYKDKYFLENRGTPDKPTPNDYIALLSDLSSDDDIICSDVGQNQMWVGQTFKIRSGQRFLTSGGLGSMGYALPAAIGSSIAAPQKKVIAVTGDGGIQINIQEFETIVRNKLPIKIFVMNNSCLGMVRQFQDFYFEGRRQSTLEGYSTPDFTKVAEAYGITSFKINSIGDAKKYFKESLEINGPSLCEVILTQETEVVPKVIVGRPIEDQHPFLDRKELKENMLIDIWEEKDE